METLAALKPAFKPDGTVTAGNACPLNDGAAAVLVMSEDKARELGLEPRARIIASSVAAIRPEIMGLGPIPAIRAVLKTAGLTIDDIDAVEMNEAFAAQVVPCRDELGIDPEKLNPNGGAIALGHPFGMTGARIMTTLLNNLDAVEGSPGTRVDVRRRRHGPGHDRRAAQLARTEGRTHGHHHGLRPTDGRAHARISPDGCTGHRRYARDRRGDLPRPRAAGAAVGAGFSSNRERADELRQSIESDGGTLTLHQGNVGDPGGLRARRRRGDRAARPPRHPRQQCGPHGRPARPRSMSVDDWHKVLRINLSGAFYMSKPALEHMIERGSGRIINISSLVGEIGNIGQANYAASKSGLFGFTKTLAREAAFALARRGSSDDGIGLTVNAVTPGLIETDMVATIPPFC